MKTLTVFSMCLNEIHFIELYLRSALSYADEIILIDGGSTDGTLDILNTYHDKWPDRIKFEVMPQVGEPYSKDWDTATRRQRCLDLNTSDWVMQIDVDEMAGDKLIAELPNILNDPTVSFARGRLVMFHVITFWRDFKTIRVNHPNDPRWSGFKTEMWTDNGRVGFRDEFHHSGPSGFYGFDRSMRGDLDIFHLHYSSSKHLKYNDNRRGDLNCHNEFSNPDWEGKHLQENYTIRLQEFTGEYPKLLKEMGFV